MTDLADHDRGPDHVRQTELGRRQTHNLSEDVQPPYDPSDDSTMFPWDELSGCSVPVHIMDVKEPSLSDAYPPD